MNTSTADWQDTADALRAEIDSLRTRLETLETAGQRATPGEHWSDTLHTGLQSQLKQDREAQNGDYAFAVVSAVAQASRRGHSGTAFGITTFDKATDLPTRETLTRRRERALLLLSDPLVLPLLRAFYEMGFEGEALQATAEQLARRVGDTPDAVDAALRPLVANSTLERGLWADNTPFYEWSGNGSVIAALLFQD